MELQRNEEKCSFPGHLPQELICLYSFTFTALLQVERNVLEDRMIMNFESTGLRRKDSRHVLCEALGRAEPLHSIQRLWIRHAHMEFRNTTGNNREYVDLEFKVFGYQVDGIYASSVAIWHEIF
jgi:hypothetical protein